MILRFLIACFLYGSFKILGQRTPIFADGLNYIESLNLYILIALSVAAMVLAGAGLYAIWRQTHDVFDIQSAPVLHVICVGLLTLIIISFFIGLNSLLKILDLDFENHRADPTAFILLPLAFMIVETLYLFIHWCLNCPPKI